MATSLKVITGGFPLSEVHVMCLLIWSCSINNEKNVSAISRAVIYFHSIGGRLLKISISIFLCFHSTKRRRAKFSVRNRDEWLRNCGQVCWLSSPLHWYKVNRRKRFRESSYWSIDDARFMEQIVAFSPPSPENILSKWSHTKSRLWFHWLERNSTTKSSSSM